MSNQKNQISEPGILFFGMLGRFSSLVLQEVLRAGITIKAVVIPLDPLPMRVSKPIQLHQPVMGSRVWLPLLSTTSFPSIVEIADRRKIPVWEVTQLRSQETRDRLKACQADVACIACFSKRIPSELFTVSRHGFINVHPSLLPLNRGPDPLFWAFREEPDSAGVTVHFVVDRLDAGAILAQEPLSLVDGQRYEDVEKQSAEMGGRLLIEVIKRLVEGKEQRIEQDQRKSSYHREPGSEEFLIKVDDWSVKDAYRFIRGTVSLYGPLILQSQEEHLVVWDALEYHQDRVEGRLAVNENRLQKWVHFPDGWLHILYTE